MNKSIVILISILWVICTIYIALAQFYGYPYRIFVVVGEWVCSVLLLVCVIMYIRKHGRSTGTRSR
jgi:uncharacterized sodium:solute symporter family permease YidK